MSLFEIAGSVGVNIGSAVTKLNQISALADKVARDFQVMEMQIMSTGSALQSLGRVNIGGNLTSATTAANGFNSSVSNVSRGLSAASTIATSVGSGIQNFGNGIKNVGTSMEKYITLPVAAMGAGILMVGKKYETAMKDMEVFTHATGAEFNKLKDLTTYVGLNMSYTATEAADAITELSKAGMSTATILGGGLVDSLNLATAGGMKVGDAAQFAVSAINSFRFEALTTTQATNTLAGAANSSAANLQDLQASLKYVGVSAGLLKFGFSDVNTALALFANHGLKGSSAGTALDNMLSRLDPKTKQATATMKSLGIITKDNKNLFLDSQGNIKDLAGITEVLTDKMAKMTTTERQKALTEMFNVRGARGAGILFQEAGAGIDRMAASIEKNSDIAEMAKKKLENLEGRIKVFKSSVETAALKIYELFAPALSKIIEVLTYVVNAFITAPKSIQIFIAVLGLILAIVPFFIVGFGSIISIVGGAIVALGGLIGILAALFPVLVAADASIMVIAIVAIPTWIIELTILMAILSPFIIAITTITVGVTSLVAVLSFVAVKTGFAGTVFRELSNFVRIAVGGFIDLKNVAMPAINMIGQGLSNFVGVAARWIFGMSGMGEANNSFASKLRKPAEFLKDFISEIKNFDKVLTTTGTNGMPTATTGAGRLIQKFGELGYLTVKVIDFVKEIKDFNKVTTQLGTDGIPRSVDGASRMTQKFGELGSIAGKVITFVQFLKDFNKTSVVFGTDNVPHVVTGIDRLREKYPQLYEIISTLKSKWDALKIWLDKNGKKTFDVVVSGISDFAKWLGKLDFKKIEADIKIVAKIITDVYTAIKFVASLIMTLITPFALIVKGIIGQFKLLYDVLLGHSIIPDIVNGIISWFLKLPSKIVAIVISLATGVQSKFNSLKSTVMSIITSAVNGVINVFNTIIGKLGAIASSVVSTVKSKLSSLGSAISSAAGSAIAAASNLMNGVKNTILGYAGQAYSWGTSIVSGILKGLAGVGGSILNTIKSSIPSSIASLIPGFASGVRNFVGGLAVVGEKGAELVSLPSGSNVYDANTSASMMKNQNSNLSIVINYPNFTDRNNVDMIMSQVVQKLKMAGVV